jgi:hypothetical protein
MNCVSATVRRLVAGMVIIVNSKNIKDFCMIGRRGLPRGLLIIIENPSLIIKGYMNLPILGKIGILLALAPVSRRGYGVREPTLRFNQIDGSSLG